MALASFGACLLASPRARADAGQSADAGIAPDAEPVEVVVTASRFEQRASESAVATQVITRREIEQTGARNAAELLRTLPALHVQESFRGTELWLRGLDPEYTLILIDGERIPGRIGGAIDLSRFGVERIERVEIVRGPSSALYGSEAIAGVVNIISRESNEPLAGDALASYGSGNSFDATGFVAGKPHDNLRLSATSGYHQADAFRREPGEATAGSERDQWSAGGSARFDPNTRHRLSAGGDYTRLSLAGVDEGAGGALLDRTQLQEQALARASHRFRPSARVRWDNRASYGQFRDQYLVDQRGGTALDSFEESREHLLQLTSMLHLQLGERHGLTVGGEALGQRMRSPRLARRGERERFAGFAQYDYRVWERGPKAVRIVPGLRYDWDSQFGQQLSPKLTLRIDPHQTLVLRLSYGRGFVAPSFQQLLLRFENPSAGYVVEGNPALDAERSHGVDVSAEWSPHERFSLITALFRNDLRGMITTVTKDDGGAAGTVYTYDNLSSAWTMGAETAFLLRHGQWLALQGSYALTYGYDGENERVLEGRARHRPTAQLRLAVPAWQLSCVTRASVEIGRRYFTDDDGDGRDQLEKPPALVRADLRVAQQIGAHVELFVGIDNLADASDAFTALRPRTYYGGARGRY